MIELALSVISACLPTLRPIFTHFNPTSVTGYSKEASSYKLGSSRHSSNPRSHTYGNEARDDDGLPLTEREPGVQTLIETNHKDNYVEPMEGGIVVSRDISTVDGAAEHV